MQSREIANLRQDYTRDSLSLKALDDDPFVQFQRWFDAACAAEVVEPNAMTLATADEEGRPSSRIVLLKGVEQEEFLFFTNYESRKGRELEANPHVALNFHWQPLERQVNIMGTAQKISRERSEAYYQTRPRNSRLGAWASPRQSSEIDPEATLTERLEELERSHPGDDIPIPPFWGGYAVVASQIEFWQGRPNRLHDRFCYRRKAENRWDISRLSP